MCGSAEHDSLHLYVGTNSKLPPPLGTAVVDAAIELFAASLPLQGHRVQEGALEHIETILSSSVSQRNAAKDVAVAINICTALLFTLQVFCGESASPSITLKAAEVEKAIQDLLHVSRSNFIMAKIGRLIFSTSDTLRILINRFVILQHNASADCVNALATSSHHAKSNI